MSIRLGSVNDFIITYLFFEKFGFPNFERRKILMFLLNDFAPRKVFIFYPKLLRSSVRKKCSSDLEKLLKFEAEDD